MMPPLQALERELDAFASEAAFSGVVRIDRGDRGEVAKAFGLAHRGYQIPNDVGTQFAIASGTKGLTALTVVSLIAEGILDRSTTARSLLGPDLPLIRDDATVERLLSHRSGIGDYFDEEAEHDLTDYVMPVPVHELATTEQYLAVLDGHPTKFTPESASRTATWVRRAGADRRASQRRPVPRARASARLRAGRDERQDAGVSVRTAHDPGSDVTHTVISNTTDGGMAARPVPRRARGSRSFATSPLPAGSRRGPSLSA